ncbi:hypothetical protein K449DRAFT_382099 [Hypoxylon sp. EC38]|nr:hypothetical protein K449DRAFT_382099 [Hypoxylon sp. EC38]
MPKTLISGTVLYSHLHCICHLWGIKWTKRRNIKHISSAYVRVLYRKPIEIIELCEYLQRSYST